MLTNKSRVFNTVIISLSLYSFTGFTASNNAALEIKNFIHSPYNSWGVDPEKLSIFGINLNKKNQQKAVAATINLEEALKLFHEEIPVTVAVIDTGVDKDHELLKNNIVTTTGAQATAKNYGKSFENASKPSTLPNDDNGHGSNVAGIILSIAKNSKILPLKYYLASNSGVKNLNASLEALKTAIDSNVAVINYSGGGPDKNAQEEKLLKMAEEKGIIVVAAAGNESTNIDLGGKKAYYPASYNLSNIITTASYTVTQDLEMELLPSSNYGKLTVDIAAPGHRINSASPGANHKGTSEMSGTSQATALVTGVVSMIKSNFPKLTAQQIKSVIIASAVEVPSFKGKLVSNGKLDAAKALEMSKKLSESLNKIKTAPITKLALKRSSNKKSKKVQI
jgi:subtilisin family serine protease